LAIGPRAAQARALVERAPARVAELAGLAGDADWLVALRAMDLLEKLAPAHPEWVQPYKRLFIGPLADSAQWEFRLQIARALPLLKWTPRERRRVIAVLRRDASHEQLFVRAWAVDGLAATAETDETILPIALRELAGLERSGSRALRARARRIRERLAHRLRGGSRRAQAMRT
jgi:hypothetical protein